jgi:UDP-galactopyranose mutase
VASDFLETPDTIIGCPNITVGGTTTTQPSNLTTHAYPVGRTNIPFIFPIREVLYEKLFKHYTYKQWKKYPEELFPEVLARIPVRNNYDTRYFSDRFQALPEHGYTNFFEQIVKKKSINHC